MAVNSYSNIRRLAGQIRSLAGTAMEHDEDDCFNSIKLRFEKLNTAVQGLDSIRQRPLKARYTVIWPKVDEIGRDAATVKFVFFDNETSVVIGRQEWPYYQESGTNTGSYSNKEQIVDDAVDAFHEHFTEYHVLGEGVQRMHPKT